MSFAENIEDSLLQNYVNGDNRTCFVCHEKVTGPVVYHDGSVDGHEILVMLVFHPKCANLMGQRLIADGFPHRRKG